MFQRILVPLDGSARAEHAIPVASRLARASHGTIIFAHIVMPPIKIGEYSAEAEIAGVQPRTYESRWSSAEHYLEHILQRYKHELEGVHIEQEMDTGATAGTVFSIADMESVDLIIVCSHGAHPLFHWMFKSVARAAVRHCPVPILVLKESEGQFLAQPVNRPLRMLVPLDGSPLAETALQPALQLLLALTAPGEGEIHLVQGVELPSIEGKTLLHANEIQHQFERDMRIAGDYLQEVAHRLCLDMPVKARPMITWSTVVSQHVTRSITELALPVEKGQSDHFYDLVAMATHGRTGLQRMILGSVTEHMLGATDLPMLIVRPASSSFAKQQPEEMESERLQTR